MNSFVTISVGASKRQTRAWRSSFGGPMRSQRQTSDHDIRSQAVIFAKSTFFACRVSDALSGEWKARTKEGSLWQQMKCSQSLTKLSSCNSGESEMGTDITTLEQYYFSCDCEPRVKDMKGSEMKHTCLKVHSTEKDGVYSLLAQCKRRSQRRFLASEARGYVAHKKKY